jgi:methylthioribose-1-phosphate isomerase
MDPIPTITLKKGAVELIDQTRLPEEYTVLRLERVNDLCEAIYMLRIRGAPALGVAGAYGMLLAIEEHCPKNDGWYFDGADTDTNDLPDGLTIEKLLSVLETAAERIASTRPTAVNLGWAITRMRGVYRRTWSNPVGLLQALHREAVAIYREDLDMCRAIGQHGEVLLKDGDSVLTHCNTGGLATSGFGTALGVVFAAVDGGKKIYVYADETRPLLQGARLNAWECEQRGIPVSVLCDGAAASLLSGGRVSCVIVGADRIAANGDTANKIGTLNLAIVSKSYSVPFYVAAPSSTIDMVIPDGDAIPIEQRSEQEVKAFRGVTTAPESAHAYNPAFDVTPCELIAGFITEKGILQPPFE